MFIKVTLKSNGDRILINTDHIVHIIEKPDGCKILTDNHKLNGHIKTYQVNETNLADISLWQF